MEIPEVERIAVTILKRASPYHLVLRQWVWRLVSDPDYAEHLDTFPVDPHLRWACEDRNYRWEGSALRSLTDLILVHEAYYLVDTAEVPEFSNTRYAETITELAAMTDATVCRLATTLVAYRRQGRPSGKVPAEIVHLSSPFALVTTSLSMAIVDYLDRLSRIVWFARDDIYYQREG